MNIKEISCVILLLFTNIIFSQVTYKGKITDRNDNVLPKSLIQVFDKDTINILGYSFANDEGEYIVNFDKVDKVIFKISAYNYDNYYQSENAIDAIKILNFNLTTKTTELKEVIIISQQKTAKVARTVLFII